MDQAYDPIKTKLDHLGIRPDTADQIIRQTAILTLARLAGTWSSQLASQPQPLTNTDLLIRLIQQIQLAKVTNEIGSLVPSPNGAHPNPLTQILAPTLSVQNAAEQIEAHAILIGNYLKNAEKAAHLIMKLGGKGSGLAADAGVIKT